MRPKTITLSTLPERLHPVCIDRQDALEFCQYWHDGATVLEHPYDDWDDKWNWLSERQDERLRQRNGMETVLKLSEYSCRLVPERLPFLDNPRHE